MEDILASIKRIIAEDHDTVAGSKARVEPRAEQAEPGRAGGASLHLVDSFNELPAASVEVLELTQPIENSTPEETAPVSVVAELPTIAELRVSLEQKQDELAAAAVASLQAEQPSVRPVSTPEAAPAPAPAAPIISEDAALASRHSLAALSAILVKPEPGSDNTLEGLVREMLRPMLKSWLDQNLPELVEKLVEREIGRITGRTL